MEHRAKTGIRKIKHLATIRCPFGAQFRQPRLRGEVSASADGGGPMVHFPERS